MKTSASVTEIISLHNACRLKLKESKVWMCVPAAGGWAASSLGSEAAACWALAAASLETVSFGLDKGIGEGRKCLGNPLKNQAPDLFHTWRSNGRFNARTYTLQLILVLFSGLKHSPLAALYRSCIATRRVADCHTASHTWCTCSARREEHRTHDLWLFFLPLFNFSRQVHPAHLLAVLAHNGFNPGRPQLLATQQTARHPITAYGLFYVIQAVYQAPAAAQERGGQDTTLNATANHPAATSVRWCQRKRLRISQISHPILSCSIASIFSARAITLFIISFSSSVRSGPGPGPGCMVQVPLSAKQ